MTWTEKINKAQEHFSSDAFSVPHPHPVRKKIMRQIETRFIKRDASYDDLNAHHPPFHHWWNYVHTDSIIKISHVNESMIKPDHQALLNAVLSNQESYWLAFEFSNGSIFIYKASLPATHYLSHSAMTWAHTFHLIDLSYQRILSLKVNSTHSETLIKAAGKEVAETKKLKNKLSEATKWAISPKDVSVG